MSRIGKKPIEVPSTVKVAVTESRVQVEGPKGKLEFHFGPRVKVALKDKVLTFTNVTPAKTDRALQGTARSVVSNMIKGVTEGYLKELSIEGVGFKAQVQGKQLNLSLGFTHPVLMDIPEKG